jgi:Cu(I)/Ag(I) efflux system membrane protein CusA/SilA
LVHVIESAIGGTGVSQTVEGRERYSINVRYVRDERRDLQSLERVLVSAPGGDPARRACALELARDEEARRSGADGGDVAEFVERIVPRNRRV